MPGGTTTTKTKNQVKPYPASKPILNQVLRDAFRAYKGGVGSEVYTGSEVVPQSQQTQQGLQGIMQTANRNINGANGLSNNLQDIIKNGGFNDYQSGALNRMQGQLKGLGGNGLTGAQDSALANFRSTANGNYDPNANPGAQGVLDASIRDATNAVNLNATAAGRYGSGTHEGVLAQKVGDLSNSFRYNDFNNWLGRKDAANSNMATLGQQGFSNLQSGAGNLFNAGQAGLGNMTSAYAGLKQPFTDQLGVGAAQEDLYKRQLDDRLRIFNDKNNAPLKNFQNYLGLAGLNGQFNSSSGTSTAPGPNPFLQGLGTVATGAGLLGSLGLLGGGVAAGGAAAGGGFI